MWSNKVVFFQAIYIHDCEQIGVTMGTIRKYSDIWDFKGKNFLRQRIEIQWDVLVHSCCWLIQKSTSVRLIEIQKRRKWNYQQDLAWRRRFPSYCLSCFISFSFSTIRLLWSRMRISASFWRIEWPIYRSMICTSSDLRFCIVARKMWALWSWVTWTTSLCLNVCLFYLYLALKALEAFTLLRRFSSSFSSFESLFPSAFLSVS